MNYFLDCCRLCKTKDKLELVKDCFNNKAYYVVCYNTKCTISHKVYLQKVTDKDIETFNGVDND